MKINLDFEYDKLHLKEITILIPKFHHNLVSFLTPILGLYGINVKEFITEFESKTKFINFDVTIPTRVRISKIKTFQIFIKTPYVISILSNIPQFSLSKSNLNVLTVYKITFLKSIFRNYELKQQNRIYSSIRKYLSKIIKASFLTIGSVKLADMLPGSEIRVLKSANRGVLFLKNLIVEKYGTFVVFNNVNNNYIGYLKSSLSLMNLSITKVMPKLLSNLANNNYFYGNMYYISSSRYNFASNFFNQLLARKVLQSSLFVIYYRFGTSLLSPVFAKSVFTSFNTLNPPLALIKLLNKLSIMNLVRSLNLINKKIIYLINHKNNANIPSNIT